MGIFSGIINSVKSFFAGFQAKKAEKKEKREKEVEEIAEIEARVRAEARQAAIEEHKQELFDAVKQQEQDKLRKNAGINPDGKAGGVKGIVGQIGNVAVKMSGISENSNSSSGKSSSGGQVAGFGECLMDVMVGTDCPAQVAESPQRTSNKKKSGKKRKNTSGSSSASLQSRRSQSCSQDDYCNYLAGNDNSGNNGGMSEDDFFSRF